MQGGRVQGIGLGVENEEILTMEKEALAGTSACWITAADVPADLR